MFRSSMSGAFPQRLINDDDVEASRRYDKQQKYEKEDQVNSSKYKKQSNISVGDQVLVRNYRRRSKFQPRFNPEQYIVSGTSDYGRKLEIERLATDKPYYAILMTRKDSTYNLNQLQRK